LNPAAFAVFILLALAVAAPDSASSFQGPLRARNGFPLASILDAPYLERATCEDSLSFSLSHSSVDFTESDKGLDFRIDLEATELVVRYGKSFAGSVEIGVDVPFASFNGGFLDEGIVEFHEVFGIESGKNTGGAERFRFEVSKDGLTVLRGESGRIGLGDIRAYAKKELFRGDSLAVALMADLEFPTGNPRKGYGNGRLDKRVAILAERKFGGRVNAYANIGKVFPGDLRGFATLPFDDYRYGGLGIEASLSKRSSLLGQFFIQDTPLPREGLVFPVLLARPALVTVGYRYSSGMNVYEFSLTENLKPSFSPDLMLNVTIRRNLK
jgi:hypothetical protein